MNLKLKDKKQRKSKAHFISSTDGANKLAHYLEIGE